MLGRSSMCTRTFCVRSADTTVLTNAVMASFSAVAFSPLRIGTTTTCTGAMAGGSTRPASSECVMTSAPISRVETPQLVAHTSSRVPSAVWKNTSKARAKFCPRKWDVPLWSAHPFCMSASMVKVSSAPAKRSEADLTPFTTGRARRSSQTEAYRSSCARA